MTGREDGVRDHLALALDVSDLGEALELWSDLADHFAIAKVGLQLFTSAGPRAVEALRAAGASVFLDLKLHDIPNTVRRAAENVAGLGASLLTVHAAGGEGMVAAAVEGFAAGAPSPDGDGGGILAVTVLTSEPVAPPAVLSSRAALAARCGCAGLVCATPDLAIVGAAAPGLVRVVPAVRLPGSSGDDQSRVATPAEATLAGADVMVVGRTVTAARERLAAADRVTSEVASALAGG